MYSITAKKTGEFEIYNGGRKKVVFKGSDSMIKSKAGAPHEFKKLDDLLSAVVGWVSLATFKKITKMLRP
jgi:hypothetical protein